MQPHAGVAEAFGTYIAGVLSQIDIPSESCFSTFHPQIGVCLDGLLMILLGLCVVNPLTASGQDRIEGPTCRPLRRPLARPLARPLRRPLASKPAFLKRFRVGQKLAISAEVSHCSGQLLRTIMCSSILSRKHGFATCAHTFSVLSADFCSPCGRGGFFVISLFRCCADICCENGGRHWPTSLCASGQVDRLDCFWKPLSCGSSTWVFRV